MLNGIYGIYVNASWNGNRFVLDFLTRRAINLSSFLTASFLKPDNLQQRTYTREGGRGRWPDARGRDCRGSRARVGSRAARGGR